MKLLKWLRRRWYLHKLGLSSSMRRVTVLCGGTWVDVPAGLRGVKAGQWFRVYQLDGSVWTEAQADEDGHEGVDAAGFKCGEVGFSLDTVRWAEGVKQ